ncbi:hypothetical protein ANO14919_102040 [Xylariales sp. No.14919]|nr:hypothetical protein ANO14919_102040 [Xylariales sp. No.14919]
MYFYVSTVPREKRYGKYKKVLYLEPPFDGAVTVKRRVTTVVPPPPPPPQPQPAPVFMLPEPEPVPTVVDVAPALPPPPPPAPLPEPVVEPDSPIDVIAVDIDPSEAGSTKSSRTSKSYKSSRSSKRHSHSRDREVYIERERVVPVRVAVPYPVQAEPQYDTFRYVEAPRRYEPRRRSPDHEIVIEDHRRRQYIRE